MKVLVLLFLTIPVVSLGQSICHDFENHDLTAWIPSAEGHWCISDENALGGDYSLRHCFDNDEAGTDRISLIHDPLPAEDAVWNFKAAYQFAPSANNHWAVLITENCLPGDDGSISSGLILGVNYIGNSDEISVWEVRGGVLSEILNTGINWQESVHPGVPVELKLSAQDRGAYTLRIEMADGSWLEQGFSSQALENPNIFSLWYKYTSSYDQGLWLDDLCIAGNFLEDTKPPAISSIYMMSSREMEVEMDEPVTWGEEADWQVGGMQCAVQNSPLSGNIKLGLPDHLEAGRDYLLGYPRLSDIYGNERVSGTYNFYYPRPYDLLISEIMADPTPGIGLPETEYLSILNASGRLTSIKEWILIVNGRSCRLPSMQIKEGEEVVLLPEGSAEVFADILPVQGIASFPALNNQGAELVLCNATGTLVHAVHYLAEWHDPDKRDG